MQPKNSDLVTGIDGISKIKMPWKPNLAKGSLTIHDLNAKIICKVHKDTMGNIAEVEARWEGGDLAGISSDLMFDADPNYLKRIGATQVRVGNILCNIVGYDNAVYYVRRAA